MRSNRSLAINLLAVALGMLALAFASVPLYRLFCQATGYNGTTQESSHASSRILDQTMTIRFNADTDPNLPWEFKPGQLQMQVRIGQQAMTHFIARNLTDHAITGRAVYNVTPFAAGAYFVKMQCFCFSEQTLQPGQTVNMPVVFYVDPAATADPDMKNVKTITLSYTFFEVKKSHSSAR